MENFEQDLKRFLEKYNISEDEFNESNLQWGDLLQIAKNYTKIKPTLDPIARFIIDKFLSLKKVHSVRYRIKNVEHLIEKIIRKRLEDKTRDININNYQTEITDLIGVRALHLFKEDWMEINDYIIENWELNEKSIAYIREGDTQDYKNIYVSKNCEIKVHPKGYRSVHYLIKSNPTKKEYISEIQVRTIFEEGWSEIDHSLQYPYNQKDFILAGFLGILNRLAGSSDELASFTLSVRKHLQDQSVVYEQSLDLSRKTIKDLQNEINSLKKRSKNPEFDSILNNLNYLQNNIGKYYSHLIPSLLMPNLIKSDPWLNILGYSSNLIANRLLNQWSTSKKEDPKKEDPKKEDPKKEDPKKEDPKKGTSKK